MIKQIQELGYSIEKLLTTTHDKSFAELSLDSLNSFEYNLSLEGFEKELSQWMVGDSIPNQLNVYNSFGQPPVTVFNNGKFVVDLYFWMHSDTSIHTHSFSGAFKVLYGRSLHETYTVKEKESFSHDVMTTDISRDDVKVLTTGSTQKILPGDGLCHRVIHLDVPTVTLCIRTVNDLTIPQWHHFENGLSILKRELSESIYKKVFYFQYLLYRNEDEAHAFLKSFILGLETSEVMNLFEQVTGDSIGLEEYTVETFYNYIIEKYQQEKWFSVYEDFCKSVELYVYPESEEAVDKFMAHATNTNYPEALAKKIFSKIKSK